VEAIASYLRPEDTVVDAGGGAGRVSLPLALRCQEVINVDLSPGMKAEFEAAATEAGITNARFILSDWLDTRELSSDLVITSNVTYFVRDIVSFVRKMDETAKRRVVMTVWSVPPPNQSAPIFQLVYGEEQEQSPGHKELLPVLWDMGILPDIRVLSSASLNELPQTHEAAVQEAARGQWLSPKHQDLATSIVEQHLGELYEETPEGYRPLWQSEVPELLITWEPGK
jgi:cyclopropane fatty-acyl-phospholipid synthase-like methyltransferase